MRRLQARQRPRVEMVIVVVADQHEIDRREIFKCDARRVDPSWTGEGKGRDTVGPDRIDENVQAGDLYEQGGVTHHGDAKAVAVDPLRRLCLAETGLARTRATLPARRRVAISTGRAGLVGVHLPG